MEYSELGNRVIGCAMRVHSELGPGLMESTYEQCLAYELSQEGIEFQLQVPMPLDYRGMKLECGYRVDVLAEQELILKLKCVEQLLPIHEAQILTYMKIAKIKHGFLINFNVTSLRNGLKSFILKD